MTAREKMHHMEDGKLLLENGGYYTQRRRSTEVKMPCGQFPQGIKIPMKTVPR